jgi:hypothetical protein
VALCRAGSKGEPGWAKNLRQQLRPGGAIEIPAKFGLALLLSLPCRTARRNAGAHHPENGNGIRGAECTEYEEMIWNGKGDLQRPKFNVSECDSTTQFTFRAQRLDGCGNITED